MNPLLQKHICLRKRAIQAENALRKILRETIDREFNEYIPVASQKYPFYDVVIEKALLLNLLSFSMIQFALKSDQPAHSFYRLAIRRLKKSKKEVRRLNRFVRFIDLRSLWRREK